MLRPGAQSRHSLSNRLSTVTALYEAHVDFPPGAEYVVPSWPATPAGRRWREVTQNRDVPAAWIGKEPLFPWEAKVYTLA
jgi:hypothetical protein